MKLEHETILFKIFRGEVANNLEFAYIPNTLFKYCIVVLQRRTGKGYWFPGLVSITFSNGINAAQNQSKTEKSKLCLLEKYFVMFNPN